MRAFKFVVRDEIAIPSMPGYSVSNCAAIVFAETADQARDLLRRRNAENKCLPWEEVSPVEEVDTTKAHVAIIIW